MKFALFISVFLITISSFSQVGIGTTTPNAQLDIRSSSQASPSNIDGILIPKIDQFPATDPTALQDGMMVYFTGSSTFSKGFYYWDSSPGSWKSVIRVKKIDDLSDGKSDSDGSSLFLGIQAGRLDDGSDNRNVGVGYKSLYSNVGDVEGLRNTALGYASLYSNSTGNYNTAIGYAGLELNIAGNSNTAIGAQSLSVNKGVFNTQKASFNTAIGSQTLKENTTGSYNTANGYSALNKNVGGQFNTAVGYLTLSSNTGGNYNAAFGNGALLNLAGGGENIAIGPTAGVNLITGSRNILIGANSGGTGTTYSDKLYIENSASNTPLIYGEFDTNLLRFNADVEVNTGSLNVDAGTLFVDEVNNSVGVGTEAPTAKLQVMGGTDAELANNTGYIVIGPENGENIVMDNNEIMARNNVGLSTLYLQQNGGDLNIGGVITGVSDRRLKKDITQLSYGLKEILQLEPKAYFWKNREQEYKSIGLIAQEVQPIIKEIVHVADDKEKSLSISYTELIPILINAVKEQELKIKELEQQLSKNSALEARLAKLEAQLEGNSEPSKATKKVAKNNK